MTFISKEKSQSIKLSQQTVPAGVGFVTLSAAAIALALLLMRKIQPPPELRETAAQTSPEPTATVTPTPKPTVALEPLDASRLMLQVFDEINTAWTERITRMRDFHRMDEDFCLLGFRYRGCSGFFGSVNPSFGSLFDGGKTQYHG